MGSTPPAVAAARRSLTAATHRIVLPEHCLLLPGEGEALAGRMEAERSIQPVMETEEIPT